MWISRYLQEAVRQDLEQMMVFLSGPRQVGKTTLAKTFLKKATDRYYNWDNRDDRRQILAALWPAEKATLVFDELHKYNQWKGWIKGEYDRHGDRLRFLITGSARLDIYRKGGDSLQGRYHAHRLHGISVAEMERPGLLPKPLQALDFPETASPDSLKKASKCYLWEWSGITGEGARFENLTAGHLLKLKHALEDQEGYRIGLHYLRDVDKREVDFLVTAEGKPWFALECKLSDRSASPALRYFGDRLQIPWLYQITLQGKKDVLDGPVRVMPASKFLAALP